MKDIIMAFTQMAKERPGIIYVAVGALLLLLGVANLTELTEAAVAVIEAIKR